MMNDMDIKSTNGENDLQTSRHSRKTYMSFSMYQVTWTIMVSTNGMFLFFYYHTVIGLDPWLILLATGITTVWASFNDPVFAYLMDRNFKWTRKWGRRFPWIIIGAIIWPLTFILFYAAPDARINPWPAFLWFIMVMTIAETFQTSADVNINMLRADKFRTETERKKYSSYFGPFDMVAMVVGTTIPPLLLVFGEGKESYTIMAILVALIAIICVILFLPSAREDKIIIDRYFSTEYERMNYIKGVKEVLTQKSFIAFIIQQITLGVATTIMTAMIVYLTIFVLRTTPDIMTVFFAIFLTGALISVPFWMKILKKTGNNTKKVYTIGSFSLCVALIPLTFFQTFIDLGILMFIVGFAMGCVWTMGIPWILSNVQDDYLVRTGKNQKGIVIGTWMLTGLFTAFIDELIIASVFGLTGFVAGYDTYEGLAAVVPDMGPIIWGIRLLVGVIPMVLILIGTIIFWKLYPLTQEKVMENKAKLKELGF